MAKPSLRNTLFDYSNLYLFIAAAAIGLPLILFGLGSLLGWILLGSAVFFASAIIINAIVRSFYPELKLGDYFETFALLSAAACGLPLIALGIGSLVSWILIGAGAFFVLAAAVRVVIRFYQNHGYKKLPETDTSRKKELELTESSKKIVSEEQDEKRDQSQLDIDKEETSEGTDQKQLDKDPDDLQAQPQSTTQESDQTTASVPLTIEEPTQAFSNPSPKSSDSKIGEAEPKKLEESENPEDTTNKEAKVSSAAAADSTDKPKSTTQEVRQAVILTPPVNRSTFGRVKTRLWKPQEVSSSSSTNTNSSDKLSIPRKRLDPKLISIVAATRNTSEALGKPAKVPENLENKENENVSNPSKLKLNGFDPFAKTHSDSEHGHTDEPSVSDPLLNNDSTHESLPPEPSDDDGPPPPPPLDDDIPEDTKPRKWDTVVVPGSQRSSQEEPPKPELSAEEKQKRKQEEEKRGQSGSLAQAAALGASGLRSTARQLQNRTAPVEKKEESETQKKLRERRERQERAAANNGTTSPRPASALTIPPTENSSRSSSSDSQPLSSSMILSQKTSLTQVVTAEKPKSGEELDKALSSSLSPENSTL